MSIETNQMDENTNLPINETIAVFLNGNKMKISDIYIKTEQSINQHVLAFVQAMVEADIHDQYVQSATQETRITIVLTKNEIQQLFFTGILSEIRTYAEDVKKGALYFIEMQAISFTYLLDIKNQFQTFQDSQMNYEELIAKISKPYQAQCQINIDGNQKLNGFTLQYQETDWTFLMRMAARLNVGLIADMTAKIPSFQFGLSNFRDRGSLEDYAHTLQKNIDSYRRVHENQWVDDQQSITEHDFTIYRVFFEEEERAMRIGDYVHYLGQKLYVFTVIHEVRDCNLYTIVLLSHENALKQSHFLNNRIQGISLIGKVMKRVDNLLKLHFENMEEVLPEEKMWPFAYRALYATFYSMPEEGDYVNVYFPTYEESDAFAVNSIKQNPIDTSDRKHAVPTKRNVQNTHAANTAASAIVYPENPNRNPAVDSFQTIKEDLKTKFFMTPNGNRIVIRGDSIQIVLNDEQTCVVLREGKGMTIHTPYNIEIDADNNISMHAKGKIQMKALNQILMALGDIQEGSIPIPHINLLPDITMLRTDGAIRMNDSVD